MRSWQSTYECHAYWLTFGTVASHKDLEPWRRLFGVDIHVNNIALHPSSKM